MAKVDSSYYSLYLLGYLKETENPLAEDAEFINARAELAGQEFENNRLLGLEAYQAEEFAMEVLMAGFE